MPKGTDFLVSMLLIAVAASAEARSRLDIQPALFVAAPCSDDARPGAREVVATGRYATLLPVGCVGVKVEDARLYQCGSIFYQDSGSGSGYEIVTVECAAARDSSDECAPIFVLWGGRAVPFRPC